MSELAGLLGNWLWWIVAIVLAVLELVVPGIFFIWFAIAACALGIAVSFFTLSIAWQLSLFSVISLLFLWFSRRVFTRREAINDQPSLNQRGEAYVGRVFTLEEAIVNGRGKIKVGDSVWPVAGPELAAGTRVLVTAATGVVLTVVRSDF